MAPSGFSMAPARPPDLGDRLLLTERGFAQRANGIPAGSSTSDLRDIHTYLTRPARVDSARTTSRRAGPIVARSTARPANPPTV
jgi:hypothetical protein